MEPPTQQPYRIGMHSIVGVVMLILAVVLFLVIFYKPFPTVTVINAADMPLADVELQTIDADLVAETHELGTLQVGEAREVTVRSYEVIVQGLVFELDDERVEHESEPLPLTPGDAWRMTVGRDGEVTGVYY